MVNEPVKHAEITAKLPPMVTFLPPMTVVRAIVRGLLVELVSVKVSLLLRLSVTASVPDTDTDRSRGVHELASNLVTCPVMVKFWAVAIRSTFMVPLPATSSLIEMVPLSVSVKAVRTEPAAQELLLCVVPVKVKLPVVCSSKVLLDSRVVLIVRLVAVREKAEAV